MTRQLTIFPAAWAWLQAHSVPVLSGIYFASMGCVLLLAICVFALARRQARSVKCLNTKIAAAEQLLSSTNERLEIVVAALERLVAESRAAAEEEPSKQDTAIAETSEAATSGRAVQPEPAQPPAWTRLPEIRGEIESLMAELDAEKPESVAEPISADRGKAPAPARTVEPPREAPVAVLSTG